MSVLDKPPQILIVEDYWLVAMQVQLMVERNGCKVVGPVGNVQGALDAIRDGNLSGAIVDVNLGGDTSLSVMRALVAGQIPFAISTGCDASLLPEEYRDRPYLPKPIRESMIVAFLGSLGLAPALSAEGATVG
jgi:DNA-binding NarL/FixJ family response regulator